MSSDRAVEEIPPLDHDEAMTLAEAEITRVLALVDDLHTDEWRRPTDCTGWTVRDMLGHLLGMMELQTPQVPRHETRHGNRVSAGTCRGRTTVKWRRSSVAISVTPKRSASATTVAPKGRSAYVITNSAARR